MKLRREAVIRRVCVRVQLMRLIGWGDRLREFVQMGVEASDVAMPGVQRLVVVHKSVENKFINSINEVQVKVVEEAQPSRSGLMTFQLESFCQETLEAAAARLQVLVMDEYGAVVTDLVQTREALVRVEERQGWRLDLIQSLQQRNSGLEQELEEWKARVVLLSSSVEEISSPIERLREERASQGKKVKELQLQNQGLERQLALAVIKQVRADRKCNTVKLIFELKDMLVLKELDFHEKELDSHIASVNAALEQKMEYLQEAHREEINLKKEIISRLKYILGKMAGCVDELKNEQDFMKAYVQEAKEDMKKADLKLVKLNMVARKDKLKSKLAVIKYDKMKQMFKDALKEEKKYIRKMLRFWQRSVVLSRKKTRP